MHSGFATLITTI